MRGYSKTGKSAFTSEYAFSGKLFCQNCGSKFRRASWGTGKNKQYVWRCINREQNGLDKCITKTVKEKDLEQAFLRVMNREHGVMVTEFDEEIFRRLIEKVKVQSMVEAVFVFRTGEEVREIF
ncbi:Site-specific recombinase, DNA invertase Pin (fragment) [Candidatus Desulfosporosinus infrequens]|uniref:Site-specific recombinase, DNA invertase Pin n=1 Tax=Candidatus Desulfosporosinus infrequens TaxID=2043169 RepID=A0A2U3LEN6_9FIRM